MRRAACLFGFISITWAVAFSQEGTQQTTTPYFTSGSTALLFSFSGLANLGANEFDGGIGGKLYRSDSWAFRASLQFSTASRDIPANPDPGEIGFDGSQAGWRFGVGAAAEYHLIRARVTPFIGGGVCFWISRTESKNAIVGGTQTTIRNNVSGETIDGRTYVAGTSVGLYGLAGVEYFVASSVSLAAEYRLGILSTSRADEERTSGNTTITMKSGSSLLFGFSTGGALTLAVYF